MFNIPKYNFNLPWFMYDINNNQLITTQTVPGDMTDNKQIVLTEIPIPGLNYSPVQPSGNGNRKISFTLPLLKRNNIPPLSHKKKIKDFYEKGGNTVNNNITMYSKENIDSLLIEAMNSEVKEREFY